ncbi:hypothetical protein [Pantoea eucalypti]|uniref:hypothetical protein n=1 Tax=Pantoea eucalypti TaxID=470933 RepID=UPI001115CD23|nr:hypothetical protein [Pantoea eucalypti]
MQMNAKRRRDIAAVLCDIDKAIVQLQNVLGDEIESFYKRPENLQVSDDANWSQTSTLILMDAISNLKSSDESLRKLI